jgi:sugar lactone lactonase YvrE
MPSPYLKLQPAWALPGARVYLTSTHLPSPIDGPPRVFVGDDEARVIAASSRGIRFVVPPGSSGGTLTVRIEGAPDDGAPLLVGRMLTTDIHQVDSPLFDDAGRLYVTHSGGRDTHVPVPLYRIGSDGVREPLAVEIPNPTSLARNPDGSIYVSSRFDAQVFKLTADDRAELFAGELGLATGLAFAPDGTLYVGDRSGSILRISPDKRVDTFASLPPSVAAFHLAYGPDGCLYVAAPTLSTRDVIYRITPDRLVDVACEGFGRPQGMAFDTAGLLYVVEALAGAAGLYRFDPRDASPVPEMVLSAPGLVGVAISPHGGLALASNDTIWTLDLPLTPLR